MPIDNRNLKAGTKLVAKYHKQAYTAEVVEVEGKLKFRLADGREFKSPSAAGMAITGGSINGWAFWSVQTDEAAPATEPTPETELTAETAAPAETTAQAPEAIPTPPAEPEATAKKNGVAKNRIFRVANQKGTPEGQTKWYCEACMKSFLAPTGETPTTCPQGHKAG